jgi:glycosyltransferase involved in cell wall biosynthesis
MSSVANRGVIEMSAKAALPTRVLMSTDTTSGVFRYSLELARALSRFDVEIALATMGKAVSAEQRNAIKRLGNVELFESEWKLEWMDDPWDDVQRAGDWLLEIEAKTAPDLVHLNAYAHGALDWYAPCVIVAHSCSLSWWDAVRRAPLPDTLAAYREHALRGLHSAQLVIAPSHAMIAAVEQHFGALASSRVIANAVNPRAFAPGAKLAYVLAAGHVWDEAKNLRSLCEIATRVKWPIVIAGAGEPPGSHAPTLGGARSVASPSRTELAEWLSRASIYALPARYEPFGLSVLEAAHAGCALVLGDIPSLREYWDDAAVFVDPDDTGALERMLSYLIAEPDRRRELSQRALERAKIFVPEEMGAAYLKAYRGVMTQRRRVLEENAAYAR